MNNLIPPDKKYCHKGNHVVDKDKFYKHPHGDGKFNICIECVKEERKENKRRIKEGTIKAF